MLDLITFRVMAINIVKPLVVVGKAFQDMFAVIKAKVVRQTTHRNLADFVGGADVETARENWGALCTASLARIPPTRLSTAENFDVKRGFFEVVNDQSLSRDTISDRSDNDSTSPLPMPKNEVKEVVGEFIYSPMYQRTASSADSTRDIAETSAQNARVLRDRVKRHSTLFGDDQKPGLAEFVIMQSGTSLDASNVFARSESQQKRILCARAIRHEKLFGNKAYTEAVLSKSVGADLALVAAALRITTDEGIVTEPEVVDREIELDSGYLTAESYDDLPTPPSTPSRRVRIVKSDSYGGSINYSLRRLSRNTQDFEDIIFRTKQRYEVSPASMII